mgnify:CR=1 FL=1
MRIIIIGLVCLRSILYFCGCSSSSKDGGASQDVEAQDVVASDEGSQDVPDSESSEQDLSNQKNDQAQIEP